MTSPEGGPSQEDKSQTNPGLVEVARNVLDAVTPTSVTKAHPILEGVALTLAAVGAAPVVVYEGMLNAFGKGEKTNEATDTTEQPPEPAIEDKPQPKDE
jgi:hypothetical protein